MKSNFPPQKLLVLLNILVLNLLESQNDCGSFILNIDTVKFLLIYIFFEYYVGQWGPLDQKFRTNVLGTFI